MSVNAHMEQATTRGPAHRPWPLISAVAACVTVDVAAVWFIAERWNYVAPYVPWLLLGIGVMSFFVRTRSIMRKED